MRPARGFPKSTVLLGEVWKSQVLDIYYYDRGVMIGCHYKHEQDQRHRLYLYDTMIEVYLW